MDLGSRKYIGSKAFIDSARGRSAARDDLASVADEASPAPAMVPIEAILECINALEGPTAKQMAARLQVSVGDLEPELDKLIKLELATSKTDHGRILYRLTEFGQRARHFAKLA